MARTKISKSLSYNKQEEPIVLSKALFDLLLKEPNPADLIALYSFYYYTAKWQKTNQLKATIKYASEGLDISPARIRKAKKTLINLGLVEEVKERKGSFITGHFIRIHFIWSQNPYPLDSLSIGNREGNALSSNIINKTLCPTLKNGRTGSEQKAPSKKKDTDVQLYLPLAQRLSHTVRTQKNVKIPKTRLIQWAKELRKLEVRDGVYRARQLVVLKWYQKNSGEEYVPVAESGSAFRAKFLRIEAAMLREQKKDSCMKCPQGLDWGSYAKKGCDSSGCPQGERCYAKRQAGPDPL